MKIAIVLLFFGINSFALSPAKIDLPSKIAALLKSFEPSAVTYLSDLDLFLVASDDTTDDDQGLLFLMNERGQVVEAIEIQNVDRITDIESLSQDEDGNLLILCSLGLNKKGKDKYERNFFIRASRIGRTIRAIDLIELRPLIVQSIANSADKVIKSLRKRARSELDIESHFVRGGELYVGLKNPQISGPGSVILKVGKVDAIFASGQVDLEVWRTFDFSSVTGEPDLISDLLQIDGGLLISTTVESGGSRIWKYSESTRQLEVLQHFDELKAEGVSMKGNSIMVTFDLGTKEGMFAFGKP